MKKIILITFLAIFVFSCGYKISKKSLNDKKYYNVYIDFFKNKTSEPRIEDYLIKELKREFILYPNVRVTFKDQADFFLKGEITKYSKESISFSKNDRTLEYRIIISVKVFFENSKGNILKAKEFTWNKEYSSEYNENENFDVGFSENMRKKFIIEICRELSSEIYHWLNSYNF